jgi:hypothetical protein
MARLLALAIQGAVAWTILAGMGPPLPTDPPAGLGPLPTTAAQAALGSRRDGGQPAAGFTAPHAEAFAWLGLRQDGAQPPPLSPQARGLVPRMSQLLRRQERLSGGGLPTVTPRMVLIPAGLDLSRDQRQRLHAAGNDLGILAADQGRQQVLDEAMHLVPRPGVIAAPAGDSRIITGDGVWAAMRWSGGDLLWQDTSEHGHAVAVVDGDITGVRIDDGLVIPGRFYRIDNGTVLSTDSPVSLHVRPLSAVQSYHASAAGVPTATH